MVVDPFRDDNVAPTVVVVSFPELVLETVVNDIVEYMMDVPVLEYATKVVRWAVVVFSSAVIPEDVMSEVKVVPSVDGADVELVIVVCVRVLVTFVCNDVVFISIDVVVSVFVFVGIVDLSTKKMLIGLQEKGQILECFGNNPTYNTEHQKPLQLIWFCSSSEWQFVKEMKLSSL